MELPRLRFAPIWSVNFVNSLSCYLLVPLTAMLVALVVPWHFSQYHMTQWVLFSKDFLQLRGLPSLIGAYILTQPATPADFKFYHTVYVLIFYITISIALIRLFSFMHFHVVIPIILLIFIGPFVFFNIAIIPNIDPYFYIFFVIGIIFLLVFGVRTIYLPVFWALSAVMVWVHPAALFSAIPLMFAFFFILQPSPTPFLRGMAELGISVVVVGAVVVALAAAGRPPPDADMREVIADRSAEVQNRAAFDINSEAIASTLYGINDAFSVVFLGKEKFYGANLGKIRWHFSLMALALLVIKSFGVILLIGWARMCAVWLSWPTFQRLMVLGAVVAPLFLFFVGHDFQRWMGFIDFNVTMLIIGGMAMKRGAELEQGADWRFVPLVACVFVAQLVVIRLADLFVGV